jgi:hypothetical protein
MISLRRIIKMHRSTQKQVFRIRILRNSQARKKNFPKIKKEAAQSKVKKLKVIKVKKVKKKKFQIKKEKA